jgi:hypothetical protein
MFFVRTESRIKITKIIFDVFILCFLYSFCGGEQIRFIPYFRATWAHIDRDNMYDYAATGIVWQSTWEVCFCGEDNRTGRIVGDSIYWWTLRSSGEGFLREEPVVPNSQDDVKEDGRHSCAPTIVKHSNPYIENGKELYKMYYECARRFYDKDSGNIVEGFTQICHAVSEDGVNWKKFNRDLWESEHRYGDLDTPPTPVITANRRILQNCQYEFSGGKHKILSSCMNDGANYGVGHPSAIVRRINGGQQIWLYYYDSSGDWAQRRVYLAKSWDGFNFETPIPTNLTNPVDVKYFAIPTDGYDGYFVATQGLYNDNYFAYSFDGVNWVWYDNVADKDRLKIGKAVETHQIAYAQPAILSDKFGFLNTSYVNILSGEGVSGAPWWETAGLWLIQGKFLGIKFLLNRYFTNDIEADLNADTRVNGIDFGKMIK